MADKASAWRKITQRSWEDPAFKEKLLNDPEAVLDEYGVERSPGVSYRIVQDQPGVRNLVLMSRPGDVTVEDVESEPISDASPAF